MSNGSTGRPGGAQAPAGTTPPGQNGTPNGRGNGSNGNGNGRENREELAGTRAGAARTAAAYGAGNGTGGPRTQPSANPVRPQPNGASGADVGAEWRPAAAVGEPTARATAGPASGAR